jgi:CRISPR-associated protein Cas5h
MNKLISIDLYANFGMLKKPDTNIPVYLTFNMLHKPALLGIIGAIIGEGGFKEKGKLPEYYIKLKDLQVSIQPLDNYHEKGNFQKTIITYNNSTGMATKEEGGNLMVSEQTIIAPAFRCYFFLDMEKEIHTKIQDYLKNYYAEYLPYLGKNEFSLWWKNYQEYSFEKYNPTDDGFRINSIFIKDEPLNDEKVVQAYVPFQTNNSGDSFLYFERLPYQYDEKLLQYEYRNFAFSDWSFKINNSAFPLLIMNTNEIIQVF